MSAVRTFEVMLAIEKTPEGEERGVITLPDEASEMVDWGDADVPMTIANDSKQLTLQESPGDQV